MIEIKLSFATIDEAITAMARVRSGDNAPTIASAASVAGTKDNATPKPAGANKSTKPEAAAPAPTASAAPAAAPATQPSGSSTPSGPARADVLAQIVKFVPTHRAEIVALLAKFNAKTGKELKDEQLAAFASELAEATKPADDLAG